MIFDVIQKNFVFLHLEAIFFQTVQIDCIMAFYFCILYINEIFK